MKVTKILFAITLVLTAFNADVFAQRTLTIGSTAPLQSQNMSDTSGRTVSLSGSKGDNGLIVIFSANTCPWVLRWSDRLVEISGIARSNRIGMIAINSNEASRDKGDSMEEMSKHAQKNGYNFSYALDEGNEIADAFGAKKTPHVFVFDGNMRLIYQGAIDDNGNASSVKEHYLKDAIQSIIDGTTLTRSTTNPQGCLVKRRS